MPGTLGRDHVLRFADGCRQTVRIGRRPRASKRPAPSRSARARSRTRRRCRPGRRRSPAAPPRTSACSRPLSRSTALSSVSLPRRRVTTTCRLSAVPVESCHAVEPLARTQAVRSDRPQLDDLRSDDSVGDRLAVGRPAAHRPAKIDVPRDSRVDRLIHERPSLPRRRRRWR